MNAPRSSCPHIITIGDYTKDDIILKQVDALDAHAPCDACDVSGPNLWVCLHRNCLNVGCGDLVNNHSIKHFQKQNEHCLVLNLTSLQVYCLLCKCEVFLENNDPPIPGMLPAPPSTVARSDSDSDDDMDLPIDAVKPKGLTGLQNMGNTCYMNSALQALSNCPQLTNFFLECGAFVRLDKKPGLAKSFMFLMKEMWHKKRPSYVVPSGIAFGIKLVFPVFRGYSQQDAQEFLRCFMDQLHEELKEPVVELKGISSLSPISHDEFDGVRSDSGIPISEESSQSDGEYETCDSGPNSEKDSCADEAIDHSDPSQESGDILIPASSEQNKEHDCYISRTAVDSALSSHMDTYLTLECGDNSSEQLTMHQMQPDCYSHVSNPDSVIATDASTSCDKSDCPLLKRECKSCYDRNLCGGDEVISLDSQSGSCMCKHSSVVSASHITCSTDAYSLEQASQLKHAASQAIINSMLTAQKKKPVQYRSIISDIFDGKILSSVQCLTCDTISFTKETFQDLSLPIPTRDHLHMIHAAQGSHQKSGGTCTDVYSHRGWFSSLFNWMLSWFIGPSISLQDCLAAFFSADELKGDNMYSCEKCKKLRNGIKYSKVVELPEVLCIHLKRFRHEVMYSSKISSHVTFPLEGLDMSPFLHKSYGLGVTTYDLASVICHHGTAGSGHYTAYSLNYLNDQWYEFDDQYVTAVDAEMVRNCEAYVLFYRKSGEEMTRKRQCAVELLDRSRNENGLLKFFISKQWINKFNNFAEPGPITNTDFLCVHGGVPPQKASYASDLCTSLPQAVWEYLHDTFGGGPPCTHLYICPLCQAELDRLNLKRKAELDDFIMMNSDFRHRENPSVVYALSLNWYKTWENFVCRDGDLPTPIDNSDICYVKNNQSVLKPGSDYCSVSKEMYQYLLNIYGGGPDILLQPNPNTLSGAQSSLFRYSHLSLTNPVPSSTCSYGQNVQVHSSSRTNFSSHSQLSSSSKIPCDTEINKKLTETSQVEEPLPSDEKVNIRVENV